MLYAVCQLALVLVDGPSKAHVQPRQGSMTIVMLVAAVAAGLCRGGLYFVASRRTKDGRRWKVLFPVPLAIRPLFWASTACLRDRGSSIALQCPRVRDVSGDGA